MWMLWVAHPGQAGQALTIDTGDGLETVAAILGTRFPVVVDYESPQLEPSLELSAQPGVRRGYTPAPVHSEIRFSYPADGDVDSALSAVVAAWDGPGAPYVVQRAGNVRRLVPTTHTLPDGSRAPWTSPLECSVQLDGMVGHPEQRLVQVLTAVRDRCGVGIAWSGGALRPLSEAEVLESSSGQLWRFQKLEGSARDALDDLSRVVGGGGYLLFHDLLGPPDAVPRMRLTFYLPDPAYEHWGHRFPLGYPPNDMPRRTPGPNALDWTAYTRWWQDHPEERLPGSSAGLNWPSSPLVGGPYPEDTPIESVTDPADDPTEYPKSMGVPTPR